jgi:hypothetical protein
MTARADLCTRDRPVFSAAKSGHVMLTHRIVLCVTLLGFAFLAGCGGGADSANLNKDVPVQPKKEKDKEK